MVRVIGDDDKKRKISGDDSDSDFSGANEDVGSSSESEDEPLENDRESEDGSPAKNQLEVAHQSLAELDSDDGNSGEDASESEEDEPDSESEIETARTRWKTLRDRFSKERKKKPTGSGANLSGKWPLMPLMEFLLPMMTPRPTISNFQGPSLLELTGMTEEVYPDEVIIDDDSPEYTDETSTQVTPSSVLAQIRQEDSTPGSSSPQSVISTSEKCQRNKRRRTNSESVSETSDPLETAILEQLEKTATSREMTANEHFMIAFGRFANALSPSAQMVFRQCVMKGYETAVNFDASNQSGC
ncbi:hypothetical protein GE061_010639 [Apolygus lucorum]|uniref:MADF domain-containing protein n=1 Tax=Apolygus lucorum TaxID=248454 RepID=A0A8S9XVG3_APOLU|nr:hypothetical protein GE061_010639 [Apolygus lucorum]